MDLDLDYHGARLLEWLHGQPDHDHLYSDVTAFISEEGLPEECGRPLVEHLQHQGLVRTAIGLDDRPDSMITPEGIARLHEIRARRRDLALRAHTLRRQMLQWLYGQEQITDMAPPDWSGFLAAGEAHMLGEPFAMSEVERAASYLSNKNLITGASIDQAGPGMVRPRLTDNGHDCVLESGGNVPGYLARRNSGPVNTYIANNSGNVAVASAHFSQNVTTGLDTSKLIALAAAVRQALPVLGLTPDQQSALEGHAEELQAAASSQQPDKGKLRRLVDAIMAGLNNAATPVATAIGTSLGNEAVRAITGH